MDKYYKEIKEKLIDDEVYAIAKNYSKERHRVITYEVCDSYIVYLKMRFGNQWFPN